MNTRLKIRRTDISALVEDAKAVEMMYLANLDRAEKILEEI